MKLKSLITSVCLAMAIAAFAGSPKYVFYFIGDGMGMGPSLSAEMYNRQVLGNELPLTMFQFPVAGMCMTYSASSPVTDSAAAGTALSAGHKTKNGMLGMDPDTVEVYSVARVLKEDGYGVGLITTVSPDDATPGAFFAHVPNRSMSYEIGVQMAQCGYEFIGGAGLRGIGKNGSNPTLLEVMADNGVQVIFGPDSMQYANSERVLLLNHWGTHPNNVGYTIDSIPGTLTLPFLTQSCLDHLMKVSPDAFFMMVEGGNIDHALHADDGATAVIEILNFNDALNIAYEFYKEHPDETLIVVTADHDTGGMSLGNLHLSYWANLGYVPYQKVSKEAFQDYCTSLLRSRNNYTWNDMRQYLAENFGFWGAVPLSEEQDAALKDKFEATFTLRNSEDQHTLYANFNAFASEVFKIFNDNTGFGFTTTRHTGNPVPVFAVGVGADRFKGLNNNIEIPGAILSIVKGEK